MERRGPGAESASSLGAPMRSRWCSSGLAHLTGHAHEPPLFGPDGVVDVADRALSAVRRAAGEWGGQVGLDDPLVLLTERAALAALGRRGRVSVGGASRLLAAADGWLAVTLARDDDLDLLPALVEQEPEAVLGHRDRWFGWLAEEFASRPCEVVVERAALLGMAVSRLGERHADVAPAVLHRLGSTPRARARRLPPLVVDLSALWAGPLCASLLGQAGCRVVKVESSSRPDGLRQDSTGHFDLLNAGKESVALDLATATGRETLSALLDAADVVIDASRARAMQQLGVDAAGRVSAGRPAVWVSITGHGRTGPDARRVAFGDDAAVAGGLVAWDTRSEPVFAGDAIADPLSGLVAAAAAVEALESGHATLVEVAMAGVAAAAAASGRAGRDVDASSVTRPRARPSRGTARALGADNDLVLRELAR